MKTCRTVDFFVPADNRVKFEESEKRDKYLDFAWEQRNLWKNKSGGDTNCNWRVWNASKRKGCCKNWKSDDE